MTQNPTAKKLYPKVDVEETFDEVVREYGGVVLKEKLPKSPLFNNADYVFHFEKIVAELKCLTEDNVDSSNNQAKLHELANDWQKAGKIKTTRIDESNWRELPTEFQREVYEITTKSIKRRIQKANLQIRETKRELKLDAYSGLVILANDGLASLPPAAFIYAAQHALARDFSEIKYFIYLTANLFTELRETPVPTLFWISFDLQRGAKIDEGFMNSLGRCWRNRVCKKTGVPGIAQEMQDVEGFWKARHIS